MSFTVIARLAKVEEFLATLEGLMPCDGEALVICATTGQEGDLGRLLALNSCTSDNRDSESSTLSVRVQSLSGFTAGLWNLWGDNRALVGSAVRAKTINELLESEASLPALQTADGKLVLSRLVSAFAPDHKSRKQTREIEGPDKIVRKLTCKYHKTLNEHGFIEHQFAIKILADQILSKVIQFEHQQIFVYGFADFTEAQLDLLSACASMAKVSVLLDWEEDCTETRYTQHTFDALLERGAQLQKATLPTVQTSNFALNDSGTTKEKPCITLGRAQGFAAEAALMVDFAQEEHGHIPYKSKALLVPHLQTYVRALTKELERRDIPYDLDIKTRFGATSFGAALIALLRMCIDENPQPNGLAFAMSAYSGLSPDEVLDLDTKWRQNRSDGSSILTSLTLHKSKACSDLTLIKGKSKSARIGDWSTLINILYAKGAHAHRDRQFDLLQDAAAQKAATTALQELYELRLALQSRGMTQEEDSRTNSQLGARILSFDPVITAREFLSALEESNVNQTPSPGSTALLLAQPSRVYGRQFDAVILGGLSVHDQIEQSDAPLDLRLGAKLSGTKLPDIGYKQQFTYRSNVALAKERLYLVAQHQTLGGEEVHPGGLLCQLKQGMGDSFDSLPCRYKYNDEAIPLLCSDNPKKQQHIKDMLGQLDLSLGPADQFHLPLPPRGVSARYDLGYRKDMPVSATTLQTFAQCPYNWLLHRFADGKSLEKGFTAAEQGNFAHLVLKKFYERLQQNSDNPRIGMRITKENLADALELFHKVFAREAETLRGNLKLEVDEQADLEMLRINMKNFLEGEVDYAPEFIPTYFEYRFGHDEDYGKDHGKGHDDNEKKPQQNPQPQTATDPVDIGMPLHLRGSIDRVDLREDGAALVIDYKRKNKVSGLSSQAGNHILQGYLYRRVAEKALGVRPVSHSYRSYGASDGKISEAYTTSDNPPERPLGLPKIGRDPVWGLSEKAMDKYFDMLHHSAAKAANDLIDGSIEKRKSKELCTHCLFDDCEHKPSNRGQKQ